MKNRGDIIQCDKHKPLNEHIKYKFKLYGFFIDKIKHHNSKIHIWINSSYYYNIDYCCGCLKCD